MNNIYCNYLLTTIETLNQLWCSSFAIRLLQTVLELLEKMYLVSFVSQISWYHHIKNYHAFFF